MSEEQIKQKLDTLADYQAMVQALELQKQQLLDEAIPKEGSPSVSIRGVK